MFTTLSDSVQVTVGASFLSQTLKLGESTIKFEIWVRSCPLLWLSGGSTVILLIGPRCSLSSCTAICCEAKTSFESASKVLKVLKALGLFLWTSNGLLILHFSTNGFR
jgi:hypothetical protein